MKKIFIILLIIVICAVGVYWYMQNNQESQGDNINTPVENLISNVDPFLFTNENLRLIYEGGPSHWGSRTVTFENITETESNKIVTLHVVDESDLKGDLPKKEWNEKWEAKSDGSLYIDGVLMLKSPVTVGQKWTVENYKPIIDSNKSYTAEIKITDISEALDNSGKSVKRVTTALTIEDIKTVDDGVYTETRVFESGIGIKEVKVTEPTIEDLTLTYWLQSTSNK